MKDGWLSELVHKSSVITSTARFMIVVTKVLFGQLVWFGTRWTSKATYQQISANLGRLSNSLPLVFIEELVDEGFDASILVLLVRLITIDALLRESVALHTRISLDDDTFVEGLS